jgi:hypothetical protein
MSKASRQVLLITVVCEIDGQRSRLYMSRHALEWLDAPFYSDMRRFGSRQAAEDWIAEYVLTHPQHLGRVHVEEKLLG